MLTTDSRSVISYVHFFTSLPLSVYVLFYTTSICAYIFYLVYFILLTFLFLLRMHKTCILLFTHECLPLLHFQVFMRSNSLAFFGDIYKCIITLQKFQISQLLAVLIVFLNILVISLIMACSSQNM